MTRRESEEDKIDRQLREFEKIHPATPRLKIPRTSKSMDSFVWGIERELKRAEKRQGKR